MYRVYTSWKVKATGLTFHYIPKDCSLKAIFYLYGFISQKSRFFSSFESNMCLSDHVDRQQWHNCSDSPVPNIHQISQLVSCL